MTIDSTARPVLSPALAQDVVLLSAPTQVWSAPGGGIDAGAGTGSVHGLTHADWRYLSGIAWSFSGQPLDLLFASHEASGAHYRWALRTLDDATKDPRVLVSLDRRVAAAALRETVRVQNASALEVVVKVAVTVTVAIEPLWAVRAGLDAKEESTVLSHAGLGVLACTVDSRSVTLRSSANDWNVTAGKGVAQWDVVLAPGESWECDWSAEVSDESAVVIPGCAGLSESALTGNVDLDRWAERAVADLKALTLAPKDLPDAPFIAAGAPWYMTLFGRDALWSALLLLPDDIKLAHGTLRALAHFQATAHAADSNADPGKILHELRAASHGIPREGLLFPAVYFGSVDSTLLWVRLLHKSWRAGLAEADVAALLPALRAAVGWLLTAADPDGDGFVEYSDASGRGLANQGWKDSSDAIQFHDGTLARGPVALVEVQAYAYAAAIGAAELIEHFGNLAADTATITQLRDYAADLQKRFQQAFWVTVDGRRYPAVALDKDKRAVDSLTSNIGHLLGTGLLSSSEEADVAKLLIAPDMHSGYGLRTLSSNSAGYWPLSYHCGSVWAHDTAIAIDGLLQAGCTAEAQVLAAELLAQAVATNFQVPELVGGQDAVTFANPVRYPTSCFPQAWSAAAVGAVRRALSPGSD